MSENSQVKKYSKRLEDLKEDFESWKGTYKDISEYVVPSRGRFLDTDSKANDGKKRNDNIIDSTAIYSLDVLAAGMQGGLTSPARPWFKLTLPDKDLVDYAPVKDWLEAVRSRMSHVFSNSNYYNATHNTYYELGGFGTGAKMIEEDPNSIIRCYPFTMGEYYLSTDKTHRVDTFYRIFKMKAVNVVDMFGEENVSDAVMRMAEKNKDEWVQIVHAIEPNPKVNPDLLFSANKPWISCYYEYDTRDGDQKLRESGFDEFPITAPRWSVAGSEVYGRSPGMNALGDVKMLQKMQEKSLKGLDKLIDPPMNAPSSLRKQGTTVIPGGVNWIDNAQGNNTFSPTYQINPDFNAIEYKIEKVQQQIKTAFYVELFLMLANSNRRQITATEIAERHEEKLLMVGPVIERIQPEMLDKDIDRVFGIMSRNGLLPPPPEELEGVKLEVEYISLLAQAQKMVGTSSIEKTVSFAGELSALNPEVVDVIDFDEAVEQYADMAGSPPNIIRPEGEREKIRQQRALQAAAQQRMDAAAQMADGAKTLSGADMGSDNALTRIAGANQ